jgi:choline-sulfatase
VVPASPSDERVPGQLPQAPNFVIIITDQERFPQHWPAGWADANLPNRRRLARHGLTFERAFCNASMCSPSRATLLTGLYPAQHGVAETLIAGESTLDQPTLQPATQNMASMLASAGYDVQWRGKWHLSKDPTGLHSVGSPRDLGRYGFRGWLPPEGGQDAHPENFGGSEAALDAKYAAQAVAFLEEADSRPSRPFALFVSLINPHDIMGRSDAYGKDCPGCFDQGIPLPLTFDERLDLGFKPAAQAQSTAMWAQWLGAVTGRQAALDYVNFYAFLHRESDRHIGTVLDALESRHDLCRKTVIIHLADHGEMGMAHGGMRQKAYNAYEETIHVPLVIANPVLFPGPSRTGALVSLIDVMPTLAALAQVPDRNRWDFRGRDLTPIIRDAIEHPRRPTATGQDCIFFTSDEMLDVDTVTAPSHVRCLREAGWKIVMYVDPGGAQEPQYELYDLAQDPLELHNMADSRSPRYDRRKFAEMTAKLERKIAETGDGAAPVDDRQ